MYWQGSRYYGAKKEGVKLFIWTTIFIYSQFQSTRENSFQLAASVRHQPTITKVLELQSAVAFVSDFFNLYTVPGKIK